jgi:glycosyltransferase involved in cell wall biosynthesis
MSTEKKDYLTILFIPLEPEGRGLVHRGNNSARMLSRQNRIIGIRRTPDFGNMTLKYFRLFFFWLANFHLAFRHRRDIDLIFAENIHAVPGVIIGKILHKPCIWDTEGDDHLWAKAWEKKGLIAWLTLRLQSFAGRSCNLLLVPCEDDRRGYIERGLPEGKVRVIPLCVDFAFLTGPEKTDKKALRERLNLAPGKTILLYTGNRNERPYLRVAEWICRKLAPELNSYCRDEFIIVLSGAGPVIPAPPQVIFTGFVENFTDYLFASDIGLFPVWFDMGMAGKVVEYMAAGKPVATTGKARGYPHLQDNINAILALDEKEYIQKVMLLMRNPVLREEMGARARDTALKYNNLITLTPELSDMVAYMVNSSYKDKRVNI